MKKTILYTIFSLFVASACTQKNYPQYTVLPEGYEFPKNDTLSVVTWNVEHFVDEYDNPYINNDMENKPKNVEKKVDLLANMLRKINADVVVLEEFENRNLAMKIAKEKLGDLGYKFFTCSTGDTWYMNVVIMSKLPLGATTTYHTVYGDLVNYTDSLGRKETQNSTNARMVTTEVRAKKDFVFHLTGVHLKAGRSKRDVAMRKGQMDLLRIQADRILLANKNAKMVMVGDFNSTPDSEELQHLLKGTTNSTMIDPLANTSLFSHPSDNPKWRIDHILINKSMSKYLVPNSVQVPNYLDKNDCRALSDHLPLVARFVIK